MAQTQLILDTETRSDRDLRKCGVYVYSERPITGEADGYELLLLAWRLKKGDRMTPVKVWSPLEDPAIPPSLERALRDPRVVKVAHNAAFDRVIVSRLLYGHDNTFCDPSEWLDTMAIAAVHGLPKSLEYLVRHYDLGGKLSEGKELIRYFNMPRIRHTLVEGLANPPTRESLAEALTSVPDELTAEAVLACKARSGYAAEKKRAVEVLTTLEKWDLYKQYNIHDTEILSDVVDRLPPMPRAEQEFWALDQRINDRGVLIDADLAQACDDRMTEVVAVTRAELKAVTGCNNPASVTQMREWITSQGVQISSLNKETVAKVLLKPSTPEVVKQVLKKRKLISASSTAKFKAMEERRSGDNRARGCFQYYGAHTGRFAGRGIQLQNLPRIPDTEQERIALIALDPEGVRVSGEVSDIKMLLRASLIAPPGEVFTVSDFSAIEARVLAWLAGETWELDAFREGQDIYKATWVALNGFTQKIEDVTGEERQRGKIATLALGYGGGVMALLKMGGERLAIPDEFAEAHWLALREEYGADQAIADWDNTRMKRRYETWQEWQRGFLLPTYKSTLREAYLNSLKVAWRAASPRIVQFWYHLDAAFMSAAFERTTELVGPFVRVGPGPEKRSVAIRLPSGRNLIYRNVRMQEYRDDDDKVRRKIVFTHATGQPETTWGGKLTENVVQAVARDVLRDAMLRADKAGAKIVAHIHDEIVVEGDFPLTEAMVEVPEWAKGLPLNAEGGTSDRYLGH